MSEEFTLEIYGTCDGEAPNSPAAFGNVRMELYDSGYNFDLLCEVARKQKALEGTFRQNCRQIFAGENTAWVLWMVVLLADEVELNYYNQQEANIYCLKLKRPSNLGLRFFARAKVGNQQVEREITCLMHSNRKAKICRTQIEEFRNRELVTAITLYTNRAHQTPTMEPTTGVL